MRRLKFITPAISVFLIILFFTTCGFKTQAQSVKSLENRYDSLTAALQKEKTKLDSLNKVLNSRVQQINDEKSKQNPDKDKITQLMASSVTISNEVDLQQKTVSRIETEIESMKEPLNKKYSAIIDSLNSMIKKDNSNVNKDKIQSEIVLYTEKKLSVAPKINLLSFHPDKILEINLNKIDSTSEKKMYEEYLQKALTEVNDRLKNVDHQSKEVGQIIELKKKTKRFIEETEFGSNVHPQTFAYETTPNNAENYRTTSPGNAIGETKEASYAFQALSYSFLLNQLNTPQFPETKIKWNTFLKNKNSNISIEEYDQLLKDVKKRLDEYKLVLLHKLGKN